MTILNRNQIIELGQSTLDLFDFMEADKVYVETSHLHFTGEPQVTLDPKGNTLSVISKEHGKVDIFSPTYNNYLPHNLIAIHY
jgi:hypothetical protein